MPDDTSHAHATVRPVIAPVPTGVTAFVGRFQHGDENVAIPVTSLEEAMSEFGPPMADGDATFALTHFFANGGRRAYAVRVAEGTRQPDPGALLGSAPAGTGLHALAAVDDVDLLCLPDAAHLGLDAAAELYAGALDVCETWRAFLLVDLPRGVHDPDAILGWVSDAGLRHRNAALYAPRVRTADPWAAGQARPVAASGAIAGVYARTDRTRGVWKAPAGPEADLRGIVDLDADLSGQQQRLTPNAVNVLRRMPGGGSVVWGARTLVGDGTDPHWEYVPIRRTALYIERSLVRGLAWATSEPNDASLWAAVRIGAEDFLHRLWRQGALRGQVPAHAYVVLCDRGVTMTQADLDAGIVVVDVGVALLKPAEFVFLRLQWQAGAAPAPDRAADAVPVGSAVPAGSAVPLGELDLPETERAVLRRVAARARPQVGRRRTASALMASIRHRSVAPRPGTRVVFAGESGPGQNVAARALAGELGLGLLRVDPGRIIGTHIGETEKNLGRVLDAAAASATLLLFDEADALFGRRTDTAGASDPDVSQLLARLAGHTGVVILVTRDAELFAGTALEVDAVVTFPTRS